MPLKKPPYSQKLLKMQSQGLGVELLTLFVGKRAWQEARIIRKNTPERHILVLPPGADPYDYFWPVRGAEIAIWDTSLQLPTDEGYIKDLIIALYRDYARHVWYLNAELGIKAEFHKE
jgi:hypothetical protein